MLYYTLMRYEREILEGLETYSLEPIERLGQHFLIDERVIGGLSASVIAGSGVIEVGSGIGHVTEALAQRAGTVVGIEIDKRFPTNFGRYPGKKSESQIYFW